MATSYSLSNYTPLATPATTNSFASLSPAAQEYIRAKAGWDLGSAESKYGNQAILDGINDIITYKGGQKANDWTQVEGALSPLIAKRNQKGLGGIGSLLKIAAPLALSFLVPGLGTAIGAGLGLSGAAGAAAGGAILGAGTSGLTSALTGGKVFKDALTGGVTGGISSGIGSALNGGGQVLAKSGPLSGQLVTPGISNAVAQSGPLAGQMITPNIGSGIGTSIGNYNPSFLQRAGSAVARVQSGLQNGITDVQNGIAGTLGLPQNMAKATAGGLFSGVQAPITGGNQMTSNPLGALLSGAMNYNTQSDIEKKLKAAQQQAMGALSPYQASGLAANSKLSAALAAGFNPGDLSSDAGYQFRLAEGQKGLNNSLAARGLGQSGAALKAAQEYGQNFANNEYTDAYNRWLQNNSQLANASGQGYNAASNVADIYGNLGQISASGTAAKGNTLSSTLSSLLSGRGIIGYDSYGQPIYG